LLVILQMGSWELFAWMGLEPQFSWSQPLKWPELQVCFTSTQLQVFYFIFFKDRVLLCDPGWPGTCNPPASPVLGLLGVHHHANSRDFFFLWYWGVELMASCLLGGANIGLSQYLNQVHLLLIIIHFC
jgi:hypothetical protein